MAAIALVPVMALACALAASGCSPARGATSSAGTSSAAGASQQLTPANLALMSPDQKRAQIATSFPMQVPVPAGTVTRGEAQGNSAWDYQLTAKGSSFSVAAWYHIAYSRAEWQLTNSAESSGTVVMDFQKGDAQSRVRVEPGTPGTSNVTGIVGVGTPLLRME